MARISAPMGDALDRSILIPSHPPTLPVSPVGRYLSGPFRAGINGGGFHDSPTGKWYVKEVQISDVFSEILASKMARCLDVLVPEVKLPSLGVIEDHDLYRRAPKVKIMSRVVPNSRTVCQLRDSFGDASRRDIAYKGCFDGLVNNNDAHDSNMLIDDHDRLWSIDYGLAMYNQWTSNSVEVFKQGWLPYRPIDLGEHIETFRASVESHRDELFRLASIVFNAVQSLACDYGTEKKYAYITRAIQNYPYMG